MSVAASNPMDANEIFSGEESSQVLPDPRSHKQWTWARLASAVVRVSSIDRVAGVDVDVLCNVKNKKQFSEESERVFPFRTKADIGLRRTRLYDYRRLFHSQGKQSLFRSIIGAMPRGSDLIWVTNLVAATWMFGALWFSRWVRLGAFSSDITHFVDVTKWVHDRVKTQGLLDKDWMMYVECNGLTGYRNPPFPGFDVMKEGEELASGGMEHNLFGRTWQSLCEKFLPMSVNRRKWISFKDWVMSGEWSTSGASSVGKLELEALGEFIKVKARKNVVCDVVNLDELAEDALKVVGQVNVSIVKSELGKIRLAVAGDLYSYLKMAWMNRLFNGAYYQWPGNTSEESFTGQTNRMLRMLELCSRMFGLPYDFKGFDHQPTTVEIVGIVQHMIRCCRKAVALENLTEFDVIAANIVAGFSDSVLRVRDRDVSREFKVSGGLMSGLRWTSIVGNAWNSVVTGLVTEVLTAWGIPTGDVERFIRGDDSAIFTSSWVVGSAMNLGYQAVGAVAGDGKFSLLDGQIEFLRVWYSDRCSGYPARVIPSLTQRKPWSNQPWSEDMILKALYESLRTLRRRWPAAVSACDAAWVSFRNWWCRDHNLPVAIVACPVHSGGLGIEPVPIGCALKAFPALPRISVDALVKPLNQTPWRSERLARYALHRYSVDLGDLATQIAQSELLSTVVSDNVPDVARFLRTRWLSEVRTARVRVISRRIAEPYPPAVILPAFPAEEFECRLAALRRRCPLFGRCPEVETARSDFAKFRFKGGFVSFLRQYYPRISALLTRFHATWHLAEKLDYLSGRLSLQPSTLHPALTHVLAATVAVVLRPSKKAFRESSSWLGSKLECSILSLDLARKVYSW